MLYLSPPYVYRLYRPVLCLIDVSALKVMGIESAAPVSNTKECVRSNVVQTYLNSVCGDFDVHSLSWPATRSAMLAG